MTSYRRRVPLPHLLCAGGSGGGSSPPGGLADALDELEQAKRRVLDRMRRRRRPLAEFRRTRRLPDRIRRQVLWRDLGCRWPSCCAPIAHCDVHHLDQDPTNHAVDNLANRRCTCDPAIAGQHLSGDQRVAHTSVYGP